MATTRWIALLSSWILWAIGHKDIQVSLRYFGLLTHFRLLRPPTNYSKFSPWISRWLPWSSISNRPGIRRYDTCLLLARLREPSSSLFLQLLLKAWNVSPATIPFLLLPKVRITSSLNYFRTRDSSSSATFRSIEPVFILSLGELSSCPVRPHETLCDLDNVQLYVQSDKNDNEV